MIRISTHKPGVHRLDDRWGRLVPGFGTYDYGYVGVEQWLKLRYFESPVPNEPTILNGSVEDEVTRRLKMSGYSAVWEFNALHRSLDDSIRFVAHLGEPTLVRWTWADAYLRRPFWIAIAFLCNFAVACTYPRFEEE